MKKIKDRLTSNKSRHLKIKNKLKKLEKFDFKGKIHFEEDGTQKYLVFKPIYRYFREIIGVGSGNYIYFWKSKGLSDERLNSNTATNYIITPELSFYGTKTRLEFNGSCLNEDKYEICKNCNISSCPALENCLFGAVILTKVGDIKQYKYSEYGIGFDRKGEFSFGSSEFDRKGKFSFGSRGFDRNCIIFGADTKISSHANNKKNNIFVLGKDFVQGIKGTTIYAEKMYSIILLKIIKGLF